MLELLLLPQIHRPGQLGKEVMLMQSCFLKSSYLQMFFISVSLILKFYSMYKIELIVLIHLLNKEKVFRCSGGMIKVLDFM